jgi:hypothetical protein
MSIDLNSLTEQEPHSTAKACPCAIEMEPTDEMPDKRCRDLL